MLSGGIPTNHATPYLNGRDQQPRKYGLCKVFNIFHGKVYVYNILYTRHIYTYVCAFYNFLYTIMHRFRLATYSFGIWPEFDNHQVSQTPTIEVILYYNIIHVRRTHNKQAHRECAVVCHGGYSGLRRRLMVQ